MPKLYLDKLMNWTSRIVSRTFVWSAMVEFPPDTSHVSCKESINTQPTRVNFIKLFLSSIKKLFQVVFNAFRVPCYDRQPSCNCINFLITSACKQMPFRIHFHPASWHHHSTIYEEQTSSLRNVSINSCIWKTNTNILIFSNALNLNLFCITTQKLFQIPIFI